MTYRDPWTGKFAKPLPEPSRPKKRTEYAIFVYNDNRSDWLESESAAMAYAKRAGLDSFDESQRERYLAVPVALRTRQVDA